MPSLTPELTPLVSKLSVVPTNAVEPKNVQAAWENHYHLKTILPQIATPSASRATFQYISIA